MMDGTIVIPDEVHMVNLEEPEFNGGNLLIETVLKVQTNYKCLDILNLTLQGFELDDTLLYNLFRVNDGSALLLYRPKMSYSMLCR